MTTDHLVYFGRKHIGRYELLAPLASGGMGTVFVARTTGIGGFERLVAVKMLHSHLAEDPQFITMLLDEARLAARIRHPNVVSVLDVSSGGSDGYFLVMDYVEGVHLGALVAAAQRASERLPPESVVRIMTDALLGLDAAHRLTDNAGNPLDMVHRDISPHNVLVGADGVARLSDFGVAKASTRLVHTIDGTFKGKTAYAAPEQLTTGDVDQRSDVFSMGAVLFEALAGTRLFPADERARREVQIPRLAAIDASLAPFDPVVARALADDPADRFQGADELMEALEEASGSLRSGAKQVATVVERYGGDLLAEQRQKVQDALRDEAGHVDAVPATTGGAPPPSPDQATLPNPSAGRRRRPTPRARPGSRRWWLGFGPVIAVAALVWALVRSDPESEGSSRSGAVDTVDTPVARPPEAPATRAAAWELDARLHDSGADPARGADEGEATARAPGSAETSATRASQARDAGSGRAASSVPRRSARPKSRPSDHQRGETEPAAPRSPKRPDEAPNPHDEAPKRPDGASDSPFSVRPNPYR